MKYEEYKGNGNNLLTKEQCMEVISLYKNGIKCVSIAKKFNVGKLVITRTLKRYNIPRDIKYESTTALPVEHSFFENINTEEKAYWLGFILGDGNVYKNRIYIELQRDDIEHLKKFKKHIKSHHKISLWERQDRETYSCAIQLNSKKMVADLLKLGITERKSLTVIPPVLREDLQRHFWRGVVDADGHIGAEHKCHNGFNIKVYGSFETCKSFVKFVNLSLKNKPTKLGTVGNIYSGSFRGKHNVAAIANLLYENCYVSLKRKHSVAMQIIQEAKNTKAIKAKKRYQDSYK